jgi:hypothetical protein
LSCFGANFHPNDAKNKNKNKNENENIQSQPILIFP